MSERLQRVPALPTILFADASEDYRAMARDALLEGRTATDLRTVATRAELLDYLERQDAPQGAVTPAPSLIVVDAGVGLEVVAQIKRTEPVPVVVLGDSDEPATVRAAYDAGANTYIVKPVTFLALVRLMKTFTAYWLETAELPR